LRPDRLRQRAAVTHAVRQWFHEEGFLEVHPPVLVRGPALEENLEAVSAADGWLHTSPEFAMKRILATGLGRVYAVVPCFRADEVGRHHAREFTMVEFYAVGGGVPELVGFVIRLVAAAGRALGRPEPSWGTVTVGELFGGVIPPDDDDFYRRWVERIDPALTTPTFVVGWPARQAALAEVRGEVAERVEVYLGGLEVGNGFGELRDGAELRQRFARSASIRLARGLEPHPVDEGVIAATDRLPPTCGMAIGLDRLVMALTGEEDITRVQVPP
jgi:lysyl-tRNA synthetase class 2